MKHAALDAQRQRHRAKRGGPNRPAGGDALDLVGCEPGTAYLFTSVDLEALDRALEELRLVDERRAMVMELRYYAGLTNSEIAERLEVSERTIERDCRAALAQLRVFVGENPAQT